MKISQLECLLFDFDGTLFDSESVIYETWLNVFKSYGHDLPLETYNLCIGSDFKQWSPQTHLEELTGETFDWDAINTERQIIIESTLNKNSELIDGTKELILDLIALKKLQPLTIGVVSSSTHRWVDQWLEKNNIIQHFDIIICRDDVTQLKPHPEPYLLAMSKLNAAAHKTLVIEDSINGAESAHAAHAHVAVIPNYITRINTFPDYCSRYETIAKFRHSLELPSHTEV